VQPIIFHVATVGSAKMAVQYLITAFMTPRPIPAKAAAAPLGTLRPNPKARLKDQFHEVARFKHLSPQTEVTYWQWTGRYLK
jgi:hypothetical protein